MLKLMFCLLPPQSGNLEISSTSLYLVATGLPAAVDVDAPNPDVSRNHDVYRFCREWSCFEGRCEENDEILSALLVAVLSWGGSEDLSAISASVVVDSPPPEEGVASHA
jgi:hypothetical protein